MSTTTKLTFKQLHVGAKFEFDHSPFPHWSGATGPWRKLGARRYEAWSDPFSPVEHERQQHQLNSFLPANTVGSINVTVVELT